MSRLSRSGLPGRALAKNGQIVLKVERWVERNAQNVFLVPSDVSLLILCAQVLYQHLSQPCIDLDWSPDEGSCHLIDAIRHSLNTPGALLHTRCQVSPPCLMQEICSNFAAKCLICISPVLDTTIHACTVANCYVPRKCLPVTLQAIASTDAFVAREAGAADNTKLACNRM